MQVIFEEAKQFLGLLSVSHCPKFPVKKAFEVQCEKRRRNAMCDTVYDNIEKNYTW
jgi:hypothetical protein